MPGKSTRTRPTPPAVRFFLASAFLGWSSRSTSCLYVGQSFSGRRGSRSTASIYGRQACAACCRYTYTRNIHIYNCLFHLSKCTTTTTTTVPPLVVAQELAGWRTAAATPSLECQPLPGLEQSMVSLLGPILPLVLVWARRPLPVQHPEPSRKAPKAVEQARQKQPKPS